MLVASGTELQLGRSDGRRPGKMKGTCSLRSASGTEPELPAMHEAGKKS